jgi:hypothetical protein
MTSASLHLRIELETEDDELRSGIGSEVGFSAHVRIHRGIQFGVERKVSRRTLKRLVVHHRITPYFKERLDNLFCWK